MLYLPAKEVTLDWYCFSGKVTSEKEKKTKIWNYTNSQKHSSNLCWELYFYSNM